MANRWSCKWPLWSIGWGGNTGDGGKTTRLRLGWHAPDPFLLIFQASIWNNLEVPHFLCETFLIKGIGWLYRKRETDAHRIYSSCFLKPLWLGYFGVIGQHVFAQQNFWFQMQNLAGVIDPLQLSWEKKHGFQLYSPIGDMSVIYMSKNILRPPDWNKVFGWPK